MSVAQVDDKLGSGAESVTDHTTQDEGRHVLNHELTPARARRLLLKTDLVVMPLAVLSMTLAFLDKVSIIAMSPTSLRK